MANVSIIIPFYCTPEHLFRQCMNSILVEELPEIEVLVVDDGSPTMFYSLLDEFASDVRVRIIHQSNQGVSVARNRGVSEAKGQWIMFVDADDYLNKASFVKAVALTKEHNDDVIIFNGGSDRQGELKINEVFLREGINYAAREDNRLQIMVNALSLGRIPAGYVQYFTLGSPCCKLIRRELLQQNHLFFDESVRFAEDVLFMLNVYSKAKQIIYFPWVLYFYVENAESVTRRYRPGLSKDMDIFFNKMKAFIDENHLENGLKEAYYMRAGMEVSRCFRREFFHEQNCNKDAKKQYLEFINQEPYCTALRIMDTSKKTWKQSVMHFVIKHGCGGFYQWMRRMSRLLRR